MCHPRSRPNGVRLLAGLDGAAWVHAADEAAARLGIPLVATVIEANEWPGRVGIDADGAVLVRPDQAIVWRAPTSGADPADAIGQVLRRVLDR
ncbi:hypothetical protein ABZ942_12995 [Nocardia sp. NPDC046473]|uniref:aromatic-ring hydroxylase C-terminal domain-containing protein n=1 Tax=Nocardia sp. NPDC046473 TaxID=3155733 RepID=UPI0033EDC74D